MKNVQVGTNVEVLNVVAGLFDIPTENVEAEVLTEQINAAIDSLNAGSASRAKAKWFEVPGANPYNEGDTVKIVAGDHLIGRFAEVIKPSSKANAVKAYLLTPKEGTRQGTLITLEFANIEASEFVAVAPKVVAKETPAADAPAQTEEPADQPVDQEASEQPQDPQEEVVAEEEVVEAPEASETPESANEEEAVV